ncbi:MAG: SDR family NAD(P)-dependent oxidoreductase [Gammaproteobacteria bacterium]
MNITGQVAVITGAGRHGGVGAAIAKQLAQSGCNLVLNCLNSRDEIQQIANDCSKHAVDVIVHVGDLTQEPVCQELAQLTQAKFGKANIVVNCLGFSKAIPTERLDLVTPELFEKTFNVNTLAPFLVAKAFHQLLKESGNGVLINVSSTAGFTGKSSSLPYAVAKGALNTLTLALAQALSPEIRVNAVCPSFIDSSWWRDKFPDQTKYENLKQNIRENNLLRRILEPNDVALAILSVIGNPAMTGELIKLDAGAHIGKANPR